MLIELLNDRWVPYLFAGLAGLGILMNLVGCGIYKRYLAQLVRIERKPKTWPGQMKSRFETYYKMKTGVYSVELFVRNLIETKRFAGVHLRAYERVVSQFPLTILAGGIGVALYANAKHFPNVFCVQMLGYSLLFAALGQVFGKVFSMTAMRMRFQMALTDYFTNLLRPRMEQEYMQKKEEYEMPLLDNLVNVNCVQLDKAPLEDKLIIERTMKNRAQMEPSVVEVSEPQAETEEHTRQMQLEQERKRRMEEKNAREEAERQLQRKKLAERHKREEEKERKRQQAMQEAYEEKKRKLAKKYMGSEYVVESESAATKGNAVFAEDGIICSAENMSNPDFIEDVLKEFLL